MNKPPLAFAIFAGSLAVGSAAQAAFVEDSKTSLSLRNLYYDRNDKNTANSDSEAREWGQGFMFNYTSGYTEGPVGFGVDAVGLLGVKLDSGGKSNKTDRSRKPGQLFPLDSDNKAVDEYSKAGATAKLRLSKTELRLGTLQPKLPVVSFNDGRLLPQLYEGGQITSTDISQLSLVAGQIEHAKGRSSTDSNGLSIAGANNATTGQFVNKFYYAGGDLKATDNLTLQYYYGTLEDFYAQHFVGLQHRLAIGSGSLSTDLRYFDSSSDGKNGTSAGRAAGYKSNGYWDAAATDKNEVDNRTWSAKFTYSLAGHSLGVGYQQVSSGSDFPYLNQGDGASSYLITDRQIAKFLNAGERTWLAEYAYDFAKIGVPGLKASAAYLSGSDIDAAGGDNHEWERDLRVDYTLPSGALKGLGLSLRNASLRGNDSTDIDENRLYITYSLPLL